MISIPLNPNRAIFCTDSKMVYLTKALLLYPNTMISSCKAHGASSSNLTFGFHVGVASSHDSPANRLTL
jgi:hypothetical protein